MQRLLFFLMLILTSNLALSFGGHLPFVKFENLTPNEHAVYFGESKIIQIKMTYQFLKFFQEWIFPKNVAVLNYSGLCPPFRSTPIDWPYSGECYFSLMILGDKLGEVINGYRMFHLFGQQANFGRWDKIYTIDFALAVIPHPLSMTIIPLINATANLPFFLDLSAYVNFYYENIATYGGEPVFDVVPEEQDGLSFDPIRKAIVGQPRRTGSYHFHVGAHNSFGQATPTRLTIQVGVNLKDKPVFKDQVTTAMAIPGQIYQQNLKALIKTPDDDLHHRLRFRIDKSEAYPEWLRIGGIESQYLEGVTPYKAAGTEQEITVIASSNTGGDSTPLKLRIPIAYERVSKVIINPFSLEKVAGNTFDYDLKKHIINPSHDPELRLIIDKIEPFVSWIVVSPSNPTQLRGNVPQNVQGQSFFLTLHVKSHHNGDSDPVTILLTITKDKEKIPRFKASNPVLPLVYPGQSFFYDFVENRDIFPEYEEAPYQIEFAKEFANPSWLHLSNNQLFSDCVPTLEEPFQQLYLIIKNIPGGCSKIISLTLFVMG